MSRAISRLALAALLAIGFDGVANGGATAPTEPKIACGSVYTIARGDTLFLIAARAYSDGWLYKRIFRANDDMLSDPGAVEIGNRLFIPCLDGTGPATRREAVLAGLITDTDDAGTQAEARNEQTIGQPWAAADGNANAKDRAVALPLGAAAAVEPAPALEAPARVADGTDGTLRTAGVGTDESAAAAVPSVPAPWQTVERLAWDGPAVADQAPGLAVIAPEQPVRLALVPGPLTPGPLTGPGSGTGASASPGPMTSGYATEASPAGSGWTAADLFQRAAQLVMRSAVPGGLVVAPTEPARIRTLPQLVGPTGSLATAPAPLPAPPPEPRRDLRLLTGSGFAPYAGKDLAAGGMITDLITRALREADPARRFAVTFIDDWSAHLGVLLPQGAFDVAFPYYMPDCSRLDRLTAEMRTRCTDFEFSSAFFAVQVGAFVRSGDALAAADGPDALFGKTLCRPAGQATFDLEQNALTEPYVRLVRPDSALACLVMLVRGQVDLVTMGRQEAEEEIMRRRLADAVSEAGGLAATLTLHAVVAKSNPDGRAILDLINRGLSALMASGKWFEVVASHQRAQLALAQ